MKVINNNQRIFEKGFSILEVVIYMAIVGILLVGVVDLTLIVKQSQAKFSANRRVSADVGHAVDTIEYLVKNSTGLPVDNAGTLCEDFEGTQGYNSYYLSLYYNTSSAANALPYECRGDYNATTTAVKIYWKSTADRGLWIDCYRGFINGNSGNCTTIQNYGDASYMLTSAKNTVMYNGGLQISTTTSMGNSALNVSVTMGIPNSSQPNYSSATTTASTTVVFRVKLAEALAPTEYVCGDGSRATAEVCDSTLTTACALNGNYYKGGYSEDSSTCSGKVACKNDCSGCLSTAACNGVCGNGVREGSEVCDSTLTTACALDGSYYKGGYVEDGSTCSGKAACNSTCTACLSTASCDGGGGGGTCGNGILEGSEKCDYSDTYPACKPGYTDYYYAGYVEDGATCSGQYACKSDCTACITGAICCPRTGCILPM